ncbi:MAG: hypothetical protein HC869_01410 [Rhodospirillales bacterium]|nr:hypothetical protein [Rhodospirillales bacterium]
MPVSRPDIEELTFYVEDADFYRDRLPSSQVDTGSFEKKISRCDISHCRGMCCHDGVSLSDAAARRVQGIAETYADELRDIGVVLADVIVPCPEGSAPFIVKTATRPRAFSQIIEHYPPSFKDTCCVFLLDDGRCGLQVLSERQGRRPWYFKPIACWRHPIVVSERPGVSLEVPADPHPSETGNNRIADFVAAIHCGRGDQSGRPAREVLSEEIENLSAIMGHDILAANFVGDEPEGSTAMEGALDHALIEQTCVEEPIPVSPMQQYFLSLSDERSIHHCNVSAMYLVRVCPDIDVLERAFAALHHRHDVLRYRFVHDSGSWTQHVSAPTTRAPIDYFELGGIGPDERGNVIEREAARLQGSLNIFTGPVARLAVFDLGAEAEARVLLIVHHLLCDYWSLQILFEDLYEFYVAFSVGHAKERPRIPTSYRTWCEWLDRRSAVASAEMLSPLISARAPYARLPADFPDAARTDINSRTETLTFEVPGSAKVHAQRFSEFFGVPLHLGLLGLMVFAMRRELTPEPLLLGIWNNGRNYLSPFDLTRTAGFFARPVTILVNASPEWDLRRVIDSVHTSYSRGMEYGLDFMCAARADQGSPARQVYEAVSHPDIVYNYLDDLGQAKLFDRAPEYIGPQQHDDFHQGCAIELFALSMEDRLTLYWIYSGSVYEAKTIGRLNDQIIALFERGIGQFGER